MLKRFADIIIFFIIFIIFFPVIILISLTNIIFLGFPIFFIQIRSGYKGKPIHFIKFRTMKYFNQKEKSISSYGLFLRKTKLDELRRFEKI